MLRAQGDQRSAISHYEQAAKILKEIGNIDNTLSVLKAADDVRKQMEANGAT